MQDLKILLDEYNNIITNYQTKFFDYREKIIENIKHIFKNELEYLYYLDENIEIGSTCITISATSKNMFEYVKKQCTVSVPFKGIDEDLTKIRAYWDITNIDKHKQMSFKINEITYLKFILVDSDFIDLDALNKDIAILRNKMGE